jgi:hypothetical protein
VHQIHVFRINPTALNRHSIKRASAKRSPPLVPSDGADYFWPFDRPLQLEAVGDPAQSGGVLFHIIQFRDIRGGMSKEIGYLPWRQGFQAPVRLPDAVYES